MKDKEKEFDKAISKHHKLLAKEIEGESVPWNEVKDKPMKVALNLTFFGQEVYFQITNLVVDELT